MVTRGQLLERPVIVPAAEGCLDGIYLRGVSLPLLLAPALPGSGGSMTAPAISELAYAAAYCGRASLRIDYRGVGGSEGAPSAALEDAVEDLGYAVTHLCETVDGDEVAVAAVGSGAWAALGLAAQDPRVGRLLLVSPPRIGTPPPPGTPDYGAVVRPITVVVGAADGAADLEAERALGRAHPHVRVEWISEADATFRQGLTELAQRVPRLLGAERVQ